MSFGRCGIFASLLVIVLVVSCHRGFSVSATAAQGKWFLEEFHSGAGVRPSASFLYLRTANFANITSDGNLVPWGQTMGTPTSGSMNWNSLKTVLKYAAGQGKILILGLWVCNFETVTDSGVRAFLTRLNNEAEALNTSVIWIPAWEFNQPADWGQPKWDWGLGVAGSPRVWYIKASVYVEKMTMIRAARDSLGIDNVLIGAQPDSGFRSLYPTWNGISTHPLTGQRVLVNYKEGITQADVIGCSMYVSDGLDDVALTNVNYIEGAFDWMKKIHDYVDPTKPFFAFEYNSMIFGDKSRANSFFIENTYEQIPSNIGWGFKAIVWWCPFNSSQTTQSCTYWAGQYEGYGPGAPSAPSADADIDQDGKVGLHDLAVLAKAYGSTPGSPNWNSLADLNMDGKVDVKDLAILAQDYDYT